MWMGGMCVCALVLVRGLWVFVSGRSRIGDENMISAQQTCGSFCILTRGTDDRSFDTIAKTVVLDSP